jgi:PAS domain S-box-containing protein
MQDSDKTKEQLMTELEEMRQRIAALEAAEVVWKRTEKTLLENEQNFKAVAEKANDGILIAVDEGVHVYANSRAAEITGYTVSELLKTTIGDLAHPDDFQKIMQRYKTIVEGKPFARHYETRIVRKDGEVVPLEVASAKTIWRGKSADIVIFRDITERKRTDDALQTSEALFRTAIESLPFDFFVLGEDGRYVMQNSTCKERWGDVIGKRPEDLGVDEATLALWQSNNRRAFAGEVVTGEVSLGVGEEEDFYFNIISPIRDRGHIHSILGVNIDITARKRAEKELQAVQEALEHKVEQRTAQLVEANEQLKHEIEERKQAEEALREAEEQYRSLVERASDAIIIIQNEKTVYRNPMYEKVLGYRVTETMDRSFLDFVVPEDRNLVKDHYYMRLEGKTAPSEYEVRVVTRSGRLVTMEVKPDLIEYKGQPATMVVMRDITERKEAEAALRESEERFRSVFEKSRDAICLIDGEGRYVMVNEAMCELTGVSREELVNKHYSTFMDEETHELMEQYWLQRKRSEPAPDRYEFKLIRTDGDIRIIDNVPTVIHFQDKPPLTLAILRDVTERRRMQDALESMRSRLLNLQESERSKLSRVLHDTIGQNIGILDFNLATIVEILDETSRESISNLIDNMRNVIRETGDKLRDISSGLHPRLVQELGLVAGVHNLIDRFQRATGIEVQSSIQINELHIDESVEVNLYRIVQEALTNIVKHSKCSSVLFEMSVEDGRLGVMVKDNGTGFSLKDVSQRDIEQRGMGLFIMEERAKAIGGRLQIHSEPDQGTNVQVEVALITA